MLGGTEERDIEHRGACLIAVKRSLLEGFIAGKGSLLWRILSSRLQRVFENCATMLRAGPTAPDEAVG